VIHYYEAEMVLDILIPKEARGYKVRIEKQKVYIFISINIETSCIYFYLPFIAFWSAPTGSEAAVNDIIYPSKSVVGDCTDRRGVPMER
jgi:hypothetical protein